MKLKEYTIRLCRKEEYGKLIRFLKDYWNQNHVFCKNRGIFEFQHGTAEDGCYDFVVAVHNETGEFHAVLGFILSSTYDGRAPEHPEAVYGALWKVRDDVKNKEIGKLGLGVLYYLLKNYPDSDYITLGLSGFSQQIYKSLHFDFGKLSHYYVASNSVLRFELCDNPIIGLKGAVNDDYHIKKIEEVPADWKTTYHPVKNSLYYKKRYIDHPFYHYKLFGIFKKDELMAIWVTRKISVGDSGCLRIVDMIGNMKDKLDLEGNIQKLLRDQSAEYIDCYNHGIDQEYFTAMGFAEVKGNTIIPNYFEPFEKKNIDIFYASYAKNPVVIFKGDADQDRPSLLGADMESVGGGDE